MKTSRRNFLGSATATLALAPFFPRASMAGVADGTPRLILFQTCCGVAQNTYWPVGSPQSFELGLAHAALEPHRSRLTYLQGLRYDFADIVAHKGGSAMIWTGASATGTSQTMPGYANGASIDQIIAASTGTDTAYGSLQFAVQQDLGQWPTAISSGPDQPIPSEPDPWAMFDRIFADYLLDDGDLAALRARRQSVLDVVKDDIARIEATLPTEDRIKTQAHLAGVRALEQKLENLGLSCSIPDIGPAQNDYRDDSRLPDMFPLQIDLLVNALGCDLTRIASLIHGNDNAVYGFLGLQQTHHALSHADPEGASLTQINAWHAAQFAYLLDALAAAEIIDDTLVVWGSEVATGKHDPAPVPFVVGGGANLGIPGGRFLQYDDVQHQRLLVSIAHAMGAIEVNAVGDLDQGTGPLPDLAT
jgi:Protein of unknown function (DUF1552)